MGSNQISLLNDWSGNIEKTLQRERKIKEFIRRKVYNIPPKKKLDLLILSCFSKLE